MDGCEFNAVSSHDYPLEAFERFGIINKLQALVGLSQEDLAKRSGIGLPL